MAHPFAGVPTDFRVNIGGREWFANCAWDGLAILALLGNGTLETHSPAGGESLRFEAAAGVVHGQGIIHFLVPPRRFWDDIEFTRANICAFRSDGELDEWLAGRGYARGSTLAGGAPRPARPRGSSSATACAASSGR
jgi:hypothetical protein